MNSRNSFFFTVISREFINSIYVINYEKSDVWENNFWNFNSTRKFLMHNEVIPICKVLNESHLMCVMSLIFDRLHKKLKYSKQKCEWSAIYPLFSHLNLFHLTHLISHIATRRVPAKMKTERRRRRRKIRKIKVLAITRLFLQLFF